MSRSSITKGSPHDALSKSQSYEMALSVSRRVYPEVPEEGHLWGAAGPAGRDAAGLGAASRESGRGRASAAGPCPYDGVDSTEILGGAGDRVHQRGRARSTSRGSSRGGRAISWGSISGRGGISFRLWVERSRSSASTSVSRNEKIGGWTGCRWISVATFRWLKWPRTRSRHAALSGSQLKPPALPGDIYDARSVARITGRGSHRLARGENGADLASFAARGSSRGESVSYA